MGIPIKNARIRKISTGSSPTYGITIPPSYIKNGILSEGQVIDLDITPVLNEDEKPLQIASVRTRADFRHKADKGRSSDPSNAGQVKPGQSRTEVVNGLRVKITVLQDGVVAIEPVVEEECILFD